MCRPGLICICFIINDEEPGGQRLDLADCCALQIPSNASKYLKGFQIQKYSGKVWPMSPRAACGLVALRFRSCSGRHCRGWRLRRLAPGSLPPARRLCARTPAGECRPLPLYTCPPPPGSSAAGKAKHNLSGRARTLWRIQLQLSYRKLICNHFGDELINCSRRSV